jgi:hypothetical protein
MIIKTHKSLDGIESSAQYSDCMAYRYTLQRSWRSHHNKRLVFIMLNPSTATEEQNDPTVARCQKRAMSGEYGAFAVLNLFAFRATDPADMKRAKNPVGGHENTRVLQDVLSCVQQGMSDVICGWGLHGKYLGRNDEVLKWFLHYDVTPMALKITKDGHPYHPLYVSYDARPIPLMPLLELPQVR